jgi:ribonuclease BN (tRNA processing enzyme)
VCAERRYGQWGLLPLFVAALTALSGQAAVPASPSATARVVMLGTGSPVPDPQAHGPATAIVVGSRVFLVDAGAGVTRQLAAAGFPRIKQVEATFLTHLHSDHTLGYPDLIFTTWIMGRREPLVVFGPPGLRRMTDLLMEAWREDLDIRIKGLERETEAWLKVDAREIAPGVVYDNDGVRVTASGVKHGDWKSAFGFRFDTPGKTITISGDAAPSDALVEAAKGSDVFIHEVYIAGRVAPENRPGGELWPQYMREFHTSNVELGRIAARVAPGVLVLYHVLRMGGPDEELLAGIREGGYTGRVVIARDLDVF